MTDRHTSKEQRRSELRDIRQELKQDLDYLDDEYDDLWKRANQWVQRSWELPVDSLATHVRTRLDDMKETPDHKMWDHPGVDDGEEAFPDECDGCPHYGVQCPIEIRYFTTKRFQRFLEESEDDDELHRKLSDLASDKHCQVLQEALEEWKDDYSEFLQEGEQLRMEVKAAVTRADIDPDELDEIIGGVGDAGNGHEPSPTSGNGHEPTGGGTPPDDVAAEVENLRQSLMTEDEEDAEA